MTGVALSSIITVHGRNSSKPHNISNMPAVSGKNSDKRRKRRGNAANERIQAVIEQLVRSGQTSAAKIHRVLLEGFGEGKVPVERTIQDMVEEEIRILGPAKPWRLANAKPGDIALIAPVWAVALETGIRLSKKDAEWIVRIRSAAPDLPPGDVWKIVGLYAMKGPNATERLRDGLDALLAFAPWRDVDHAERYYAAANSGRIPAPILLWDLADRAFEQKGASRGTQADAFYKEHTVNVEGSYTPTHDVEGSYTPSKKPRRRRAGKSE